MKIKILTSIIIVSLTWSAGCIKKNIEPETNIIFLHHSTGEIIWKGRSPSFFIKVIKRIHIKLAEIIDKKASLPELFEKYNNENDTNYGIKEIKFPKEKPYGWKNFPYDYYNIWVKNGDEQTFMEEPTLEILTREYNIIVFKHCFPVSNIKADEDFADIYSEYKSLSNYKLQYMALKEKLHKFPSTKFVLFTGAAQVKSQIGNEEALRAKEFFTWVINEWDMPGDNIFLWDFYSLQTEGGLYFKDEYAISSTNSHPNSKFASKTVKLLFNRLIDIIEDNGINTNNDGKIK